MSMTCLHREYAYMHQRAVISSMWINDLFSHFLQFVMFQMWFVFPQINKAKEKLEAYQKQLEEQQRQEEDKLMKNFQEERQEVNDQMQQEMDKEWEVHLHELTKKFDREMSTKGKKLKGEDQKVRWLLGQCVLYV